MIQNPVEIENEHVCWNAKDGLYFHLNVLSFRMILAMKIAKNG